VSLPLPILLSLTPGPKRPRMKLECEVRDGRYFLFAQEGPDRWQILAPGASAREEREGYTRRRALEVALLAGFSTAQAERAIRKGEAELNG